MVLLVVLPQTATLRLDSMVAGLTEPVLNANISATMRYARSGIFV